MKQKNVTQKEKMWDLLIPILIVICVLPLIVHLLVYNCGYSIYDWYSDNDVLTDFYSYTKSRLFNLVGIFSMIILAFRLVLYREENKNVRCYVPLLGYIICVILSGFLSVNSSASWQGNFESFENCLVLISYVVISFYAYQFMETKRDYKLVWYGILFIAGAMTVVGIFQICRMDLLNFSWVQRLIMSAEDYAVYGGEIEDTFTGNNVYLTLYNPNYAGVFLSMVFAVVFVMTVTEKEKKSRMIYSVVSAVLAVLIWFTYSRASLVTMILTMILCFVLLRKRIDKKTRNLLLAGAGIVFVLLIFIDILNGGKYIRRMIDSNDREPLTSMTTDETGIHFVYDETEYIVAIEDGELICRWGEEEIAAQEEIVLPFGEGNEAIYDAESDMIYMQLFDTMAAFSKEEEMYLYQRTEEKAYQLTEVEKVDLHGLEYIASARGYIWSRTFPLLKEYLLIGSGPDTFAEVFPQDDVAGKIIYSDNPNRVIEKAHNDYLTKWVQTGGISFLCIAAFYVMFLIKTAKAYGHIKQDEQMDFVYRIQIGCYLACISYMTASFVNDSTIQTAPLFWVLSGIALAGTGEKHAGQSK